MSASCRQACSRIVGAVANVDRRGVNDMNQTPILSGRRCEIALSGAPPTGTPIRANNHAMSRDVRRAGPAAPPDERHQIASENRLVDQDCQYNDLPETRRNADFSER